MPGGVHNDWAFLTLGCSWFPAGQNLHVTFRAKATLGRLQRRSAWGAVQLLKVLCRGCLLSLPYPGSINTAQVGSGCQPCGPRAESHTSCSDDGGYGDVLPMQSSLRQWIKSWAPEHVLEESRAGFLLWGGVLWFCVFFSGPFCFMFRVKSTSQTDGAASPQEHVSVIHLFECSFQVGKRKRTRKRRGSLKYCLFYLLEFLSPYPGIPGEGRSKGKMSSIWC